MENLPLMLTIVFVLTTLLVLWLFYRATRNSKTIFAIVLPWLGLQAVLGIAGFYTVTDTMPPRFLLLLSLPVAFIIVLFATKKGRAFIDGLDIKWLTILHIIRVPVELILLWLFVRKTIPEIMTFEGRNFDIFSGITAPVIYYFMFVKHQLNARLLIAWNIICILLLANIVSIAILSGPFPFQRFAFDQPNIAVLYFPFVWLPCFIVPVVLFSHLASIRQLVMEKKKEAVFSL